MGHRNLAFLAALLTAALLFAGCRSRVAGYERDWYAGGSFTAVPGVGLALEGGKVVARPDTFDLAVEAQIVRHFLDDKDFADDGEADHGRMTAVRLGLKHSTSPGAKRHATFRYGAQFYRATGVPGIVDRPGDYVGAYAGIGFETELSRNWTMGPEISVAVLRGEGDIGVEVVPTFFWHFVFDF
jgi:hypothetical protein